MTKHLIRKAKILGEASADIDLKIRPDPNWSQAQSNDGLCQPGTRIPSRPISVTMIIILLGFGATVYLHAQSQTSKPSKKETNTMNHATGTFEVKTNPQKPDNKEAESANIGRMSLDKRFQGDLEATSKGEMLFCGTAVEGSGGYVAIERVSGTLRGRSGTFVLQHIGTMTGGVPQLNVSVLPDSGTSQLAGLTGAMTIKIENGKHFYEFEYTLPPVGP